MFCLHTLFSSFSKKNGSTNKLISASHKHNRKETIKKSNYQRNYQKLKLKKQDDFEKQELEGSKKVKNGRKENIDDLTKLVLMYIHILINETTLHQTPNHR